MRIVQIANFYTPTSGGLRTCVDEIGRGYVAAGHDRILIVPGKADADVETAAGRRITLRSPSFFGSKTYQLLTSRGTLDMLDELAPDVLEVSDKLSVSWLAPWSRRTGVPLVLFSHERIDAILESRVPRQFPLVALANLCNRKLSDAVGQIVVASNFAAAEFARVGAPNVRRVPLGVDLDQFRPAAGLHGTAPSGDDGVVKLVLISRLSKEKQPDRAIAALRVLVAGGVRAELTVLGDGPRRDLVEAQARGLPVTFLGHVGGRDDMAAVIAAADVAVCPSPVESFGLAVLEALACGTPVVVPSHGAARELVGGRGSGMVTDGSPVGLADGIRSLLEVPAHERRRAARAAAERFPWSATVDGLLHLYRDYTKAPVA